MSVLIKGMKLPLFCMECPCANNAATICYATGRYIPKTGRVNFCPLVELPKHGRLIDADALFREISDRTKAAYEWRQKATDEDIQARAEATYMLFVEVALTISKLPTIVEAEGE